MDLPVKLHCFFVGIEETHEHLANLRRGECVTRESKPSASKIHSTQQLGLQPIDRVAARVVVTPESEQAG